MKQRAFTLIELLTVMAISAILLGLIVYPLIQSFNLTRTAQAFSDAQDRARVVTERLAREIGGSVSVRSLSSEVLTNVNGVNNVKLPQHALIAQLPGKDGTMVDVVLPYAKLDIVPPAQGDPGAVGPSGGYIDPNTGNVDPTLHSPKGQVDLPVAPGMSIRRLFIGLRDPFKNYNNPYDGILMARNADRDNLYVLYSADVEPRLPGGAVNTAFFEVDPITGGPKMDDPRFFVPNRDGAGNIITNDDKAQRIKNWMGLGDPTYVPVPANTTRRTNVETELTRYDMIQNIYDKQSHVQVYDGNIPRVVPLVQFRPAHVDNEPAQGGVAVRMGEANEGSSKIAPDTYATGYGLWERPIVRNWPAGWNPGDPNNNEYSVLRSDASALLPGGITGTSIFVYDPDQNQSDITAGSEVFDVTTYDRLSAAGGFYPFTKAALAADSRSGWLSSKKLRDTFVPFTINTSRGRVQTSFLISEVGDPNSNPQPGFLNLPVAATSISGPYSPTNDPVVGGTFYDADHSTINEKFNWVWNNAPNLQPNIQRFLDLRVTPNLDGTPSPLDPTTGFDRASIVPGSDQVYGPDQLPGPNLGNPVRYTRTTQQPGPNQYRINYVDLKEPDKADYALLGLTPAQLSGFKPNIYDATNFASAIIQPRYKKGYIQFNSDPGVPLPIGEIRVSYRFQFNNAGFLGGGYRQDVFAVDYDTRQLINVLLTMRNYPQATNIPNPQTITLKSTAAVRNYIR